MVAVNNDRKPSPLPQKAADNLHFLIVEVRQQIERTRSYLVNPSSDLMEHISSRDDYIDNLKSTIQRQCYAGAAEITNKNVAPLALIKSVEVVAINLERIADFCEKILRQFSYLKAQEAMLLGDLEPYFAEVLDSMQLIDDAVFTQNADLAEKICRVEPRLDHMYERSLQSILDVLRNSDDPQSQVTRRMRVSYGSCSCCAHGFV